MKATALLLAVIPLAAAPRTTLAHPDSPDTWNLPASPRFSNCPPRGN